jgi:SAM-dependent methyltransferase
MKNQHFLDPAIVYDLEQEGNTEDIDFFCEAAHEIGDPILDLGCGTGRLTIPLAEAGNKIVGLDISMEMLTRFHEKFKNRPQTIRDRMEIVQGSMRHFALERSFQMAICSSNTLFLLESEQAIIEALACVHSHLMPGGRFLIDVDAISSEMRVALTQYPPADVPDIVIAADKSGGLLQRTHGVRALRSELQDSKGDSPRNGFSVSYKYSDKQGAVRAMRHENVILLTPEELLQLLRRQGFGIVESFGWYDRRPFAGTESKLIVIAQRKE